ncbi:MAG: hypothetical protein LH654_00090 [Thermoleophilia bacterium]|nr:hypothetical protein [Thermoleophilia bacterium]
MRQVQNPLAIYLQDHHAAAQAGTAIARRLAKNVSLDVEGGAELGRIALEIEEDLQTLKTIMAAAGVTPSRLKDVLAVTAERLGRLKLNGQIRGRARLSDVIELEALVVGVTGKMALWQSLSVAGVPAGVDLTVLVTRAIQQRATVERCHQSASANAFASPGQSGRRNS